MISCPICESKTEKEKYLETYTSPFDNQNFKLYHCKNCDIQWWEPRKMNPEFYEKEIDESYIALHTGLRKKIDERQEIFFKKIPKKSGRLLDVGCAEGIFLKEAQKRGYEVWGVDFDRKSIKVAQEKFGLKNVFPMSLQDFIQFAKNSNLSFDIITLFAVLEHQDDPKKFLEDIKKILKPNGYLAGVVPNRESWLHKRVYFKVRKIDFPPHHFFLFSSTSLDYLLKEENFINYQIFSVPLSFFNFAAHFFQAITDEIGKRFREKLKKEFQYSNKREANFLFKTLKLLRNVLIFPIAIFTWPFFRNTGLYFQAQVKNEV